MDFKSVTERKHWCRYWPVKRTMSQSFNGKQWIERCKCGRLKVVDCNYYVEGRKIPSITVTWFDADGVELKVTGRTSTLDGKNESSTNQHESQITSVEQTTTHVTVEQDET